MKFSLKTLMICMAAFSLAQAQTAGIADQTNQSQTTDEPNARSVESERGRLGMQRIQTETEIRAREEQRRLEEAERERQQAQEEAMKSQEASAPAEPGPNDTGKSRDMSRTLEQLRSLGQLKDDGYITEDEFQKIKKKILDSQT